MKNSNINLIGHLQIMEEPLSSLYTDRKRGVYYLFVRIFENTELATYILSEVSPSLVIDYIEGKIGLRNIFSNNKSFYYKHKSDCLDSNHFIPISISAACNKLAEDGLNDKFDIHLAHKSVPLKLYLRKLVQ